jgi:DNA-binding XRE family transcriptional regulator
MDLYDPEYEKMIARLVNARREAAMTQAEAAKAIGKNRSTVSKIERCQKSVNILELKQLCILYGINPLKILE